MTQYSLWACKYSVRDVGFVDLDSPPYRLCCFVDGNTPKDLVTSLRQTAAAMFLDANVQFELIDLAQQPDHTAQRFAREHKLSRFPAAVLVSPEDRSRLLPFDVPTGKAARDAVWSLLERTVSSPKRDALLQHMTKAFCVVLLVEGTDAAQNRRTHESLAGAIADITRLMPRMPKPVEAPPQLMVISPAEIAPESTWLWSLDLDIKEPKEPQAAILYGRGRKIGPTLRGNLITQTSVQEILALIGQDCECDLERSWMQGPMIPARWDHELQQAAFKNLGFDPESPLVKTEISRILARGPNSRQKAATSSDPLNKLVLGYSEEVIEPIPAGTEAEESRADNKPTPASPVLATGALAPVASVSKPRETSTARPLSWRLALLAVMVIGLGALLGGAWVLLRSRRNR